MIGQWRIVLGVVFVLGMAGLRAGEDLPPVEVPGIPAQGGEDVSASGPRGRSRPRAEMGVQEIIPLDRAGETPPPSERSEPRVEVPQLEEQEIISLSDALDDARSPDAMPAPVKTPSQRPIRHAAPASRQQTTSTPAAPRPASPTYHPRLPEAETALDDRPAPEDVRLTAPAETGPSLPKNRVRGAGDRTVALLDGQPISQADLYEAMMDAYGPIVFQQLVNEKLLHAEIRRRNITISRNELEAAFQRHVAVFQARMGKQVDLGEALQRHYGMSVEEYKRNVVWVELAARELIRTDMQISDADLANYFIKHKDRYARPERVRAAHILIDPLRLSKRASAQSQAAGPAEWNAARARAQELAALARQGADFRMLAKRHSHDRATAQRGGDLGFFPRGKMVKAFEDVAFSLKAGEVSDPVKTPYGVHIIKVMERSAGRDAFLHEVKDRVREDYEKFLMQANTEILLQKLVQEALRGGRLKILDPRLGPTGPAPKGTP